MTKQNIMFHLNDRLVGGLKNVMGVICCTLVLTFSFFTSPLCLYRLAVIRLAKCFRPDLGEIIDGHSSLFVRDYTAKTSPRTNVVMCMVFQGQLTVESVKSRVLDKWIKPRSEPGDKLVYEKFQQYPVSWMGFYFWKNLSTPFSVDNYVHKVSGKDVDFNDNQLEQVTEKLLNTRLPNKQSPWNLYVIENYVNPTFQQEQGICTGSQPMSVMIFQWHHCLVDGTGLMIILLEGLFGLPKATKNNQTPSPPTKTTSWIIMLRMFTYPIQMVMYISYILSHLFRQSFFTVTDAQKDWHMTYLKSGPISVRTIKDIKNVFGASYTSVLLSAMSAAVYKTIKNWNGKKCDWNKEKFQSMLCINILPPFKDCRKTALENHMSGAIFHLPITPFSSPVERLRVVNERFEKNRLSVVPFLVELNTYLVGKYPYVYGALVRNRQVPIGLSNVAGAPGDIQFDDNIKWIYSEVITGNCEGVAGIGFLAMSHGKNTGIQVSAERALMKSDELRRLLGYVKEEINILHDLAIQIRSKSTA